MNKIIGIVIKEITYRDTSKIIEVFNEYGIFSIIARGAKRVKSPLFRATTLYTKGVFYVNIKNNIYFLREADVISRFSKIFKSIEKMSASMYLTNLTNQVCQQSQDKNIYHLYDTALTKLEEDINPLGIVNLLEIKYLKYLGLDIMVDKCVLCGSSDITYFSIDEAGVLCFNCSHKNMDKKMMKLLQTYYHINLNLLNKIDIDKKLLLELNKYIDAYLEKYTGLYLDKRLLLEVI